MKRLTSRGTSDDRLGEKEEAIYVICIYEMMLRFDGIGCGVMYIYGERVRERERV